MTTFDVVLVGGGLANALISARLEATRPDVSWIMLERGSRLFGHTSDQTWSFHAGDIDERSEWLVDLASHGWDGYDVKFPGLRRAFASRYYSIRADELRQRLGPVLAPRMYMNAEVTDVTPNVVTFAGGEHVRGRLVIDGRGLGTSVPYACGYQKFVGLNLKLAAAHSLERPLLMDATVDQTDGYRFIYVLPWSPTTVLVEDTYYGDTPALDDKAAATRIRTYAATRGWRVEAVLSQERGVLPIPLAGARAPRAAAGVLAAGVAAGRFHPTTGYSLVDAVSLANDVAALQRFSPDAARRLNDEAVATWDRRDYFRRLNNMLFRAARPSERWRVMELFYRRDAELISRFYGARLSGLDRMRLLTGRPPVPVAEGLRAFAARIDGERSSLA